MIETTVKLGISRQNPETGIPSGSDPDGCCRHHRHEARKRPGDRATLIQVSTSTNSDAEGEYGEHGRHQDEHVKGRA